MLLALSLDETDHFEKGLCCTILHKADLVMPVWCAERFTNSGNKSKQHLGQERQTPYQIGGSYEHRIENLVKDSINGVRTYGLERLYHQIRVENQMWQFGLQHSQVAAFLGDYSWKELGQVGADEYRQRYLNSLGRPDAVMEIERIVYAQKTTT